MRQALRQSVASLSESLSSSSRTTNRTRSNAEGSASFSPSSYYYYSSGSGSSYASTYEASESVSTAPSPKARASDALSASASAESATSDTASTYSAASRSSSSKSEKAVARPSARKAPDSLVSSSDAILPATTTTTTTAQKDSPSTEKIGRTLSLTTTTSNGVTVDNSDALVLAQSSSSPASSMRSLGDLAAPASPYHFSEEELARQPWPVECDAATHTSAEEGGQLVLRAPDALATIHTVSIAVPPPVEEAQRRRREGGLPFPSHLTFRIIPGAARGANGATGSSTADAEAQAKRAREGKVKLDEDATKPGVVSRAKKAACSSCCLSPFFGDKEEERRGAEERAAARQKSYHSQLRSHHVPLVNFRTTRDAAQNLLDGDNALPTVEEAAGYLHCLDDLNGAEAEPKQLQKAMRQRRRPASGLHWKTNYAFGRRAGGGPHGVGESAFSREGDPKRFWIAQLHERSQMHLEQIETE